MNKYLYKYLVINEADESWGLTVNTVGRHDIQKGYDSYPPSSGHPSSFFFNPSSGRVLDSYQLLYITEGSGVFYLSKEKKINLNAGDMFLLRPGQWHSYFPDKKTGWKEYWIGFQGQFADQWLASKLIPYNQVVFRVGIHDDIIELYEKAIDTAMREKTAYQQCLSGIVSMIMGLMVYRNKNLSLPDGIVVESINKAKIILRERMLEKVDFERVAEDVHMSYSWFRKMFKNYTGMSPAYYVQSLKLQHSKRLLATTDLPIKEISYTLNYDNTSHFTSIFKKYVGCTPVVYRERSRGK